MVDIVGFHSCTPLRIYVVWSICWGGLEKSYRKLEHKQRKFVALLTGDCGVYSQLLRTLTHCYNAEFLPGSV